MDRLRQTLAAARRLLRQHRGAWLFTAALLGIIALLFALPESQPVPVRPAARSFFPAEPLVRVLVLSLEPARSVEIGPPALRGASAATGTVPLRGGLLVSTESGAELGDVALALPVRLSAEGDASLTLDGVTYPGALDVLREGDRLLLISRVPLETYLAGVLAAEMGPRFADAALQAQAVASRSYAAARMLARQDELWDLGDDQASQVYRGQRGVVPKLVRAVSTTRGAGLVRQGRVLEGIFSSCCGGTTRAAGEAFGGTTLPPLAGVVCGRCDHAPVARWSASAPLDAAARALGIAGAIVGVAERSETPSGRLRQAGFATAAGSVVACSASRIRQVFGGKARSAWFTRLEVQGGRLVAEGRGFGHGVGLCQYGAEDLAARSGEPWQAIVARYFPGAEVAMLYPVAEG